MLSSVVGWFVICGISFLIILAYFGILDKAPIMLSYEIVSSSRQIDMCRERPRVSFVKTNVQKRPVITIITYQRRPTATREEYTRT